MESDAMTGARARLSVLLFAILQPTATALAEPGAPSPAVDGALTPDATFSRALRAYYAALSARRLGTNDLRRDEVSVRVAEAETRIAEGRTDEAISRLAAIIEDPQFELVAAYDESRAAIYRLGDALASAGIFELARAYLRRVVATPGIWRPGAPGQVWARRAVGRLVDVALATQDYAAARADLRSLPSTAPVEVLGELAYVDGRAEEAAGRPEAALSAYGAITQSCRFWAESTYLAALIQVEQGRYKQGEDLLCKVADPGRISSTTPVFADEKFFAVRDLARLGLGRIAHEQGRNDDARFYYYLVPQDSDRLAEALYEAATTRYEKKDYEGARALLDQLAQLGVHHRYEDEAWVLRAWVDLARCRFADADKNLVVFLSRYEAVRDAARSIGKSEPATQRLLAAVHSGSDAASADFPGANAQTLRTLAALVRVDPAYDRILRRRAVLEREAAGLPGTLSTIGDMQRALATHGGVRPVNDFAPDAARDAQDVRRAIDRTDHELAEIEAAHAPSDRTTPLRQELDRLRLRATEEDLAAATGSPANVPPGGIDLPDLLRADAELAGALQRRIVRARAELDATESWLAKDALRRLDLRLSRLVRRARLGRIESVLGRKRALEVEVEAIRLGYLPADAVDSLDAARYLEDNEEYWPFEGDDWPDEYVGGELK